jgi:Zn-dependent metalloprotease
VSLRNNGLRTFAFHRDQNAASPAIAAAMAPSVLNAAGDPGGDPAAMAPEKAALLLLQNALASDKLPGFNAADLQGGVAEFNPVGHRNLLLTNSQTVKFRQLYRKIPVYGSLVTVEMDSLNRLLSINSALGAPAGVDAVAKVSPAAALETVRAAAGYAADAAADPLDAQPRLVYYFDSPAGLWRLAYITEDVPQRGAAADGGDDHHLPQIYDYVVDAHSGELVAALPRGQTVEPVASPAPAAAPSDPPAATPAAAPPFVDDEAPDGLAVARKFRCSDVAPLGRCLADPSLNVHTYDFAFRSVDSDLAQLPGGYVALQAPAPWSPAAVSAHANAADVVGFLHKVLLRQGIDDEGGRLVSSINCVRQTGIQQWRNAAWYRGQMVYGQRTVGDALRSYAVARDVVAHEIFHGVTEATARLDYFGETGALNESYSDIFGILIANFGQADVGQWDWKIGEELDGSGLPLRDLSDPPKCGQPGHMKDFKQLPFTAAGDWGGVHTNSGIHNKAFFNLMTAKANGTPLFDPATVAKLFYLTLTEQLSRTSGFADSRRGLELVARSLFRVDPAHAAKLAAIGQAFDDVGITA